MKKLITTSVICLLLGITIQAQTLPDGYCVTDQKLKELFKNDPALEAHYFANQLLMNSKNLENGGVANKNASYTVPVVWHIVHQYGSENLSDNQIYDAMRVINEEFNSNDPDSVNVISEYSDLIGDCHIEFKLASIDPYGNCTNGIDHIYSHESVIGDDFSKLNRWNRSHYLNIWVVEILGTPGAAAYATPPASTDGFGFWRDGVISSYTYPGSIGTSNPGKEHVITHEIAHWINVAHTFGDSDLIGEGPTICNDDGVADTPRTRGHQNCPAGAPASWVDCSQNDIVDTLGTYTFDDVTPTSGLVDPTPAPAPVMSLSDTNAISFNNFSAVGVGANPTTTGTFGFDGWDTGALDGETVYSNLSGSINTAKYFEFSVLADPRQLMTLDSINFDVARDATGPRAFSVRWDVDGYASNLVPSSTTNPNITAEATDSVLFYNQDAITMESGSKVDLGGMQFDPFTPVTFRIYAWNAEDGAGDFIVDNVKVTGSFGTIEDVQNYMDYSYCSYHFTPGQATVMHNALEGIAGQRNQLWTDSTLTMTGVINQTLPQSALTVPLCAPVADFTQNRRIACVGENVTFSDASWNAVIDGWNWTFQDGSPATSTSANPTVSFTSSGYKTVTLTASNATGSSTETRTGWIYVSPDWADFSGPTLIDLEGGSANWFINHNFENNHGEFALSSGTGYDDSRSFKLNTYKDITGAPFASEENFYNNRLGGTVDELITPSFDLRYTTGVNFSFKYSYATNATSLADMTEKIRIYYSTDCGATWTPRTISVNGTPVGGQDLTADDIVTGGFAGNVDYEPTTNVDWATASITYTPSVADKHTRFKIEFTASDYSSNLYIDDIFVDGTLNLTDDAIALLDLNVFPNPTSNGQAITVNYTAQDEPVTFTLRDTQGKVISTEVLEQTNTLVNHTLKNTENLRSACYFLEVKTGDHVTTRKVVVL